jgi:hypothetical protein
MVDVEGVLAIGGFFSTCIVAFISFGPIGRAIGTHILRKGAAAAPPELAEQLDELTERVEAVQRQVAELAERQDFAERLLAKVREKGLPAGGGVS